MATATTISSGAWSDAIWSGGAGSGGSPADGDAVVISAGHNVWMNFDTSAWTGLSHVTIQGGETPGMLYWKNGASGYLKIKTGFYLQGTTNINRGRLLVNSDGIWGNSDPLQFSDKAIISFIGTSRCEATNLDIALHSCEPTVKTLNTYGVKFTVDTATKVNVETNRIDIGVTPMSNGSSVMFYPLAGGTLPGGLEEGVPYWVYSISGTTFQVTYFSSIYSNVGVVDITSTGTGSFIVLGGYTAASVGTTLKVVEDASLDPYWSTVDGHNYMYLIDSGYSIDTELNRITAINPTTISINTQPDSTQYSGSKLVYVSRNVIVSSTSSSTSYGVFNYSSTDTHGGIFNCEIRNFYSLTSKYGMAIKYGVDHIFNGSIHNFAYAFAYFSGGTFNGLVCRCDYVYYNNRTPFVNNLETYGNSSLFYSCNNFSNSKDVDTNYTVFQSCTNFTNDYRIKNTASAFVSCSAFVNNGYLDHDNYCFSSCFDFVNNGEIFKSYTSFSSCTYFTNNSNTSFIVSYMTSCYNFVNNGNVLNNTTGYSSCNNFIQNSTIENCQTAFQNCGEFETTHSSSVKNNSYLFSGTLSNAKIYGDFSTAGTLVVFTFPLTNVKVFSGTLLPPSLLISGRNATGTKKATRLFIENRDKINHYHLILDMYGSLSNPYCDGGDLHPLVDPNGGNEKAIRVYELQSNLNKYYKLIIFDNHRLWLTVGGYSITYKVQSTFDISEGNLQLRCDYIKESDLTSDMTTNASAITARTNTSDWSQSLTVSFTQALDGWVTLSMEMYQYTASGEFYVWPNPTVN